MFKMLTPGTINIPKLIPLLNIKGEKKEREAKEYTNADRVLRASYSNKTTKV